MYLPVVRLAEFLVNDGLVEGIAVLGRNIELVPTFCKRQNGVVITSSSDGVIGGAISDRIATYRQTVYKRLKLFVE
jgi:hypothetical protein